MEGTEKKHFDKIYLSDEAGEVTWCEDHLNDGDVAYVPESRVKELEAVKEENKKLNRRLAIALNNQKNNNNWNS